MSDKNKGGGVYINLPPSIDKKLSIVARIMPAKPDGKRYFKRDVVALACEKFVDKFLGYLQGATDIDEMIELAKEIDPHDIEIDIPAGDTDAELCKVGAENGSDTDNDLPEEATGLKERF